MGRSPELTERARYNVLAERANRPGEEGMWLLRVPELGLASAALRRDEIETAARDMIAVSLDADPHSFDVDIETLST